jgi:hypothetical protein
MEFHLNSAFLNITVTLCFHGIIILNFDAQYAKKFGKFFLKKSDDLSEFQITWSNFYYLSTTLRIQKGLNGLQFQRQAGVFVVY